MTRELAFSLYNLESFDKLAQAIKSGANFRDALPNGLIMARSLEYIDPTIFEQQYPGLTFEQTGISVDNSGGYSAAITKRKTGVTGEFRESGDDSSNKGLISLKGEKATLPVVSYEAHSNWTDTEVKQASYENRNLVSEKLAAHDQIYKRDVDKIFYLGKGSITEGISNYSGFDTDTASGTISSLTAQELYREIEKFIVSQWTAASNIPEYMANIVILPIAVYNKLNQAYGVNENSDNLRTIFAKNYPSVTFIPTFRADLTGNVTAISNSRDSLTFRVPLPLTFSEIFVRGFKGEFDSAYRVAGIDINENIAGRHLAGLV
jgi:hypothetical protein